MVSVGPPSEQVADIVGSWTGYLENFMFPSGSDAVRIDIIAPPGGTASATVVFTMLRRRHRRPIPMRRGRPEDVLPLMQALEGFPYVAGNLRWETMRLRFTLSRWSPWQVLVRAADTRSQPVPWLCVCRNVASGRRQRRVRARRARKLSGAETPPTPVACAKGFPLCMGTPPICTCDANACNATDLTAVEFDIALRSGVGDGTTNLPNAGPTSVRLTHASN